MKKQTYENHSRYHPLQHFFLMPLSFITFLATSWSVVRSIRKKTIQVADYFLPVLALMTILASVLARMNPLKAQDRIIQLEERLRYQELTDQPLPQELTAKQIIALRFASNEELKNLADQAVKQGLTPDEIKQAITHWRPDYYRI